MRHDLYAARYTVDGQTQLEHITDLGKIGVRCSLPWWLKSFRFVTRARSREDARNRVRTNQGQKMVVFDDLMQVIATGDVREVEKDGLQVFYSCDGMEKRHKDVYHDSLNPTDPLKEALFDLLTTSVPAIDVNYDDLAANEELVGEALADIPPGGVYPHDLLSRMLSITGDPEHIYDYFTLPQPFAGITPQPHTAYYRRRISTGLAEWLIPESDLVDGGAGLVRDIHEYANRVRVRYTNPAGNGQLTGWFTAPSDLWDREMTLDAPDLDQAHAQTLAQQVANIRSQPTLRQPMTIGAPVIRRADGSYWPLWSLIPAGPSYVRLVDEDLAPTSLFTALDGFAGALITTIDYEHDDMTLSIGPDRPEDRLDMILKQAGLTEGEAINSGGRNGGNGGGGTPPPPPSTMSEKCKKCHQMAAQYGVSVSEIRGCKGC